MKTINMITSKLHSIFIKNEDSNIYKILNAISKELDKIEPNQQNLRDNFSVTSSYSEFLDKHGEDYGVTRKYLESDEDYRSRIISKLSNTTFGPTVSGIKAVCKSFTRYDPTIIEYSQDAFVMGVSTMENIVFIEESDLLTVEINVQNPDNINYSRTELEKAIKSNKPIFTTVIVNHEGGV